MADLAQLTHLLRRTEYIARPSRIAALQGGTLDAAIDDILNFPATPAVPSYLQSDIDGEGWDQYVFATKWWFDRMAFDSTRPLQEKMTMFWHGHFTSSNDKVNSTYAMVKQNQLYRVNAVGNFQALTQAMAIEPAMLVYLDNQDNTKGSPNENFARELMELFTLGVGNYAESDVEASARAWTGYGLTPWQSSMPTYMHYEYHDNQHDKTNKTFFGKTQAWTGPQIIDEILTNPTKKLVASKFIVTKLWEYFAHPGPPQAVLDALVPSFAADWNIKTLLKAMFLRSEFYATAATQGLLRSPVEWIVAVLYSSNMRSDVLDPQWYTDGMGQTLFQPPNVAGWKNNAYWINSSTIGARADFAQYVAYRLHSTNNYNNLADKTLTTIQQAIDIVVNLFGLAPLSSVTLNAMTTYMTAQRAAEPWVSWAEIDNLLTMGLLAPEMHQA